MTRRPMRSFLLVLSSIAAAACGGSSRSAGPQPAPWSGQYAPIPRYDAWGHRSSYGGGDLSVGGDGNGFHYFIDSSGTSWSGGG